MLKFTIRDLMWLTVVVAVFANNWLVRDGLKRCPFPTDCKLGVDCNHCRAGRCKCCKGKCWCDVSRINP
jgi:hypothetical protein